jgi:DNA-binding MarR family transcriptional regulator
MVSEKALYRLKPVEILLLYKMLWYHRLKLEGIHELLKSENIYVDVNMLRRILYKLERKGLIERRRTWEKVNGKYRRVVLYSLSLDVKKSEKIKKMIEEIFYSVIYGICREVR